MIPLFDMKRQYMKLRGEVLDAVDRVFSSGKVILGQNVKEFERELAEYIGVKCAVGVSNGTDALILSMMALNIGFEDLVITTPYTFIASASAASWVKALPAFVDVEKSTMNMNLELLERELNGEGNANPNRIKAVVAVHLFGRSLDLERLEKLQKKYGIPFVEDVAQAFGAEWNLSDGRTRKAGSVGRISVFSFFPTKNLGAYGDGGAVLTDDEDLCEKLRMLRAHGSKIKYDHEILGKNARLDEVHAAILRVKLKYIDEWNRRRMEIATMYGKLFESEKLTEFLEYPKTKGNLRSHVFHQYVVKFRKPEYREKVIDDFQRRKIGYAVYYPKPLHLQKVFENLGYREGDFPNAEELSKTTLALPIFPELRDDEVEEVVRVIKNSLKG